jgi:hypothetical protein
MLLSDTSYHQMSLKLLRLYFRLFDRQYMEFTKTNLLQYPTSNIGYHMVC